MPLLVFGQRNVRLVVVTFKSDIKTVTIDSATKALKIASLLLNSNEFQDSIIKRKFPYSNFCLGCDNSKDIVGDSILGQTILDSIFRRSAVGLKLVLKIQGKLPFWGRCFGLGNTCPNKDSITSFYKNIRCDMGKELPFTYAYGIHICHEFAHNVGFCHTDNNVDHDITEAVGWIAYYFVKKWYDDHVLTL
ncbi:hypothetical protein [Chitinophaga arvensicola]|uniref:Uncharacterized protein n=1 Tax=Chitinophaga arvensicola TaxID=29529 RepID=A0A1I0RHU0_9BACT|nr:hypothetical protein [Chitinophaga arvensicola]SEW40448.1 hypothetical protein SAMN04488122_2857 [Chitinophaga arvensicola]